MVIVGHTFAKLHFQPRPYDYMTGIMQICKGSVKVKARYPNSDAICLGNLFQ